MMTSRAFLVGLMTLLVGGLAPGVAAAQAAVPPLPARLYGTIQLEAPRTDYLHVEIQPGPTTVQVETCLTAGPSEERCRGPLWRQTLGAPELAELTRLWNALHTPAPCSITYPSTAPTHRFWPAGGSSDGQRLPEATHQSMGYQPCVAGGRRALVDAAHPRAPLTRGHSSVADTEARCASDCRGRHERALEHEKDRTNEKIGTTHDHV